MKNRLDSSSSVISHSALRVRMPCEGVLTEAGVLFHHEVPKTLKAEHLERLREYGINIACNVRFTPEEDQRIRENWRKFSNDYGLKYEDARYYAGFMAKTESIQQQGEQNKILDKLGMWPTLCYRLEHRTAKQIQERIISLFDPHKVGTADPISTEDMIKIFQMKEQGASNFEISMALRIPYTKISTVYKTKVKEWNKQGLSIEAISSNPELLDRRVLTKRQYRRFYFAVLRSSSLSDLQVRDLLEKDLANIELQLMDFNWTFLIPQFGNVNERNLKDSWYMLMSKLRVAYLYRLPQFNDDKVAAWISASDEVMPCDSVSVDNIITYLKVLRKCVDRNNYILHVNYIDKIKLTKRLSKHGLISVSNFDIRQCTIYHRILNKLRTKDHFIFRHLNFPLTVRDKLKVFIECYEKIRFANQWDEFDRNKMKFPRIERSLFIDCLIHTIRCIDPEWQPPLLFQKWIRTMRHVDLYSCRSSNNELNNIKRDRRILRQMLFENPKSCLTESSNSYTSLLKRCPLSDDLDTWESNCEQPKTKLSSIKCSKNFKSKEQREVTDDNLLANNTSLNETHQDLDFSSTNVHSASYETINLWKTMLSHEFKKTGIGISMHQKDDVAINKTTEENCKKSSEILRLQPGSPSSTQEQYSFLLSESNVSNNSQPYRYSREHSESFISTVSSSKATANSMEINNSLMHQFSYSPVMDANKLDVSMNSSSVALTNTSWLDLIG